MPGEATGTASFSGLWVLLYVNQAHAGDARVADSISGAGGNLPCFMRWAKILSMTGWSSIQAITRALPLYFEQIDTSILNTRFWRFPQVVARVLCVPEAGYILMLGNDCLGGVSSKQ